MPIMPPDINVGSLDPNIFNGPARGLGCVEKSGNVVLDSPYGEYARWIYVGTAGALSYVKWDGTIETLPFIFAGAWHPIASKQINSLGTTIAADQLRWGS